MLDCRAGDPSSKPKGGQEMDISSPCCFPVLRMALDVVDPVSLKLSPIVKTSTDLKYLVLFSNNLCLLYHSFLFFIISLSEAVYLQSFSGMCESNIFDFGFNTHTHTQTWLFKFIKAIYMYVLLCKTRMCVIPKGH